MAVETVIKTIGATGTFSTVQLWEDGAPADLTTAERSACTTFLVATFIQGEALTFVGSGATGVMLDTDSTGIGTGTYMTYGITAGNPTAADVITGGTSTATCVLTSGTPDFTGIIWQGQCQNQEFSVAGTVVTFSGSTPSATAFKELTTVSGASFADHAAVQGNPLRYNAAVGAALNCTAGAGTTVALAENANCISKLQITASGTNGRAMTISGTVNTPRGYTMDRCIVEGRATGVASVGVLVFANNCVVQNTAAILRATGADHIIHTQTTSPFFYNCTIVAPDDLAAAPTSIFTSGASGTVTVRNCGLFAGASANAIIAGSATFTFATCASDISGTAGVTQVTYDREFQDVTDATRDFKLRPGASQINAGTVDMTNASTDIVGTARPKGPSYDIGAWEFIPGPTLWAGGMI
jgi:hypothetical protein